MSEYEKAGANRAVDLLARNKRLRRKNKLLKKILYSYHVYFTAAMRATSLGLCKRSIKHALEDEKKFKGKE